MEKKPQQQLHVKVFSPFQTFYDGMAQSLSAVNKTGPFDVLFSHSNFFTTLEPGRVVVNTGFEIIEIEINRGVLQVSENDIVLFANV